ncbi:hypothetical protein PY650_28850 [Rhizobium calliandrae]|uniref:Uncharacterized protein n=1 Tax=Rhizobium calliandrae TaxID=1312182 RepID=A0ABT7KLQ6_9HYPH|nr:hypothetical protein [Rhizobium calliandrae]MDL2409566.1 hypothetical protein [Rhizobium calliandrae]
MSRLYLSQIEQLHEVIEQIDCRVAAEARQRDVVRLQRVAGRANLRNGDYGIRATRGGIPE